MNCSKLCDKLGNDLNCLPPPFRVLFVIFVGELSFLKPNTEKYGAFSAKVGLFIQIGTYVLYGRIDGHK